MSGLGSRHRRLDERMLRMRELFISDATDVYPVSVLRGKCTVHHCQVNPRWFHGHKLFCSFPLSWKYTSSTVLMFLVSLTPWHLFFADIQLSSSQSIGWRVAPMKHNLPVIQFCLSNLTFHQDLFLFRTSRLSRSSSQARTRSSTLCPTTPKLDGLPPPRVKLGLEPRIR